MSACPPAACPAAPPWREVPAPELPHVRGYSRIELGHDRRIVRAQVVLSEPERVCYRVRTPTADVEHVAHDERELVTIMRHVDEATRVVLRDAWMRRAEMRLELAELELATSLVLTARTPSLMVH